MESWWERAALSVPVRTRIILPWLLFMFLAFAMMFLTESGPMKRNYDAFADYAKTAGANTRPYWIPDISTDWTTEDLKEWIKAIGPGGRVQAAQVYLFETCFYMSSYTLALLGTYATLAAALRADRFVPPREASFAATLGALLTTLVYVSDLAENVFIAVACLRYPKGVPLWARSPRTTQAKWILTAGALGWLAWLLIRVTQVKLRKRGPQE